MNRLKDKVIIVTGGSHGIGKATCQRMAEERAHVAITDILDEEGEQLAKDIALDDGSAHYWHLDVSNEEQVKNVFQDIREKFGKIDALVSNAGISGANKPTHENTLQEWQKTMDINVNGVFLCTKYAVPHMIDNGGGSIINMSSIYGIIGAGDIPAYHASKGAVRLMTKNDAVVYAPENIRVNSVHPAFIWTPLVEQMGKDMGRDVDEFRKELDEKHPIGHIGEPDDIAWGVVYLASDESKFMTGSELVIDGGYTCV